MKKIFTLLLLCFIFYKSFSQIPVTDAGAISAIETSSATTLAEIIKQTEQTIQLVSTTYDSYVKIKESTNFLDGLYNSTNAFNKIMHTGGVLDKYGFGTDLKRLQDFSELLLISVQMANRFSYIEGQLTNSDDRNIKDKLQYSKELISQIGYTIEKSRKLYVLSVAKDDSLNLSQKDRVDLQEQSDVKKEEAKAKMKLLNENMNAFDDQIEADRNNKSQGQYTNGNGDEKYLKFKSEEEKYLYRTNDKPR